MAINTKKHNMLGFVALLASVTTLIVSATNYHTMQCFLKEQRAKEGSIDVTTTSTPVREDELT